ncbi:MAG: N-acetyl-gamma-glutamyl-phosphate reductase [Flavobacteriaceae bacterium]|jgi:N-acetyl-gamma-glutamyl-phosphate reductase|nr:N-acetyl-gamma-glutamyl-phosphate reductase [Flavobacteriaceae bacterium]
MSIQKNKVKVGIIGGSGYTGGELIRLLINHSKVELVFVQSKTNKGKYIQEIHTDLIGQAKIKFVSKIDNKIDLLFLCVGHNQSKKFLDNNKVDKKTKIIDLSQDFRVNSMYNERKFIYGLPELNKDKIIESSSIANPGCFATAIQLGLLPFAVNNNLNGEININAITGSTGAGVKLSETSHYSWRNNNVSWYKSFNHQHLNEINLNLKFLNKKQHEIVLIPIRGNFTKGIFCTMYFKNKLTLDQVKMLYKNYYKNSSFVHVSKNEIDLKQVLNTNNCIIHLKKEGERILITSIIDNLIKGAAGQAIQNMNLMFGLDEDLGLKLKSSFF